MTGKEYTELELNDDQLNWTRRGKQGLSPRELRHLIIRQGGRCALSGVPLTFNVNDRTPRKGGAGCHPLAPAVDHVDPGNDAGDRQIICYALNDVKGHLPLECFAALIETTAWKALMAQWTAQAKRDANDREAFRRLLRPNAHARIG